MASSNFSEVMSQDSSQPYSLAQRIPFFTDICIQKYHIFNVFLFLILDCFVECSVVNIGATAMVTKAATALFGEAGVSAATGVMTVSLIFSN